MAELPLNVSTGMVFGRFIAAVIDKEDVNQEPDVIPAQGGITFTASVPYLPNPGATPDPLTILKTPIKAVLDSEGYLCTPHPLTGVALYRGVRLIATDDLDLLVTGWTWNVVYKFDMVEGIRPQIQDHSLLVPSDAEVDLTTAVKVPASIGYGLPQAEAAAVRASADATAAAQSAEDAANLARVNDSGVASLVGNLNSQTGIAIDDRINTQVYPQVEQIAANYISSQPAVVDAAAAAVDANPTIATIQAALPWRGILPDYTDVNTKRIPGIYTVKDTASAATMINWPTPRAGSLKVWANDGASATLHEVTAYVSTTAPTERYSRGTISSGNTSWSPWNPDTWNQGVLPNGTNLQTFRNPGTFQIGSLSSSLTMLDMPTEKDGATRVDGYGTIEIIPGVGTSRSLERITLDHNGKMRVFVRTTGTVSSWPVWQEIGAVPSGAPVTVSADPVSDHAARVEYARSRRAGGTGVLGKAVVMIRFDHWLVKFRDVILPIMREFDLVGTLNVNYDNMDNVQNGSGSITWGHVQDWNQYDGIEIANHGSTHTNASTRESIFHEVVDGRRNLETAMPRVAVETWQEHGSAYLTASDIDGDIGLNLGREPKNFFESYAGKLILAEHAIIEGKCGGFFTNLTGHPQVGQSHMSIDQSTAAEAIGQVDTAKQFQRGVTLYVHPGLMDTVLVGGKAWDVTYNPDGSIVVTDPATSNTTPFADEAAYQSWATSNGHTIYMRTSYFHELCAYLAAERDAGNLLVMTAAGGGFADKSHARRENLLVNPGFETTATSWWSGTSSWTITSPGDSVVLKAPASAGTLSQGMLMHSRFGWAMGATHELVLKVRSSSAASLTLRMEKLGDAATWQTEKVHAIPGDSTVREYRLNLTLPRDPSITQMSVKITGDNGLEIVGKPLLVAV